MTHDNQDQNFVHLHLHTEYSLLDGFARIDEAVKFAKELGMPALGITDHGTMFGVIDFYKACKKEGIKPIIGVESYLARRKLTDRDPQQDSKPYHMLLLAENGEGYKNLLRLSSVAQLEGYYYRPRIDRELMAAHSKGVIATSGCLAAEIPRMVEDGKDDEARRLLGWYQDVFGKDNFYIELQSHDIDELRKLNTWLLANADYADIPLLATNDVHYVRSEDFEPHDTLLCIQTNAKVKDTNRMRMTDNSYYLRTQKQMWDLFGHVPSALHNSLLIAERCQDLELTKQTYHLPVFPVPKGFADAGEYLSYLCERGLNWRFDDAPTEDAWHRLEHELRIINTMGFATYFLIVWDLTQFARRTDIWWNVRGSGAGSLVAYVLGITNLDPIENALLFERFLNPGRVSMPDMDLDFPEDRRMEMIDYCSRKYGSDKVAAIITFGTMGAKAAIRDVARALDIPLTHVDQIVRTIPTNPALPAIPDLLGDDAEKALPDLKEIYKRDATAKEIIDLAAKLEGVPRHASTHAAGVIVADRPLVEYIPLHRPTKGDAENSPVKQVTQFPMETAESIGLLKIDFLGLSTLTILRKACELIEQHQGYKLNMSNIPYKPNPEDAEVTRMVEETFEMMGEGNTIGVFQVESGGMRQMLTEMKPKTFEHIIAAISLYRPGPMDYIPMFNRRMHGEEEVKYHHPKLIPILSNTYGICISGDSLVIDAITGQQLRVDQIGNHEGPLYLQGINECNEPALGQVTHLIHTGEKAVYRLRLKNGAEIKATADHQFLTEQGWQKLGDLQAGDYIGTPPTLGEPKQSLTIDQDQLRVLAYLIADGSLSNGTSIDFVNKEQALLDEYVRALGAFEDVEATYLTQIRGVTRVSIRNKNGKGASSLLNWLRSLGLKYPAAMRLKGGCRSHEKFIPQFIFELSNEALAYFLASLWDCDGFIGPKFAHYKTISKSLATDTQTLLLRFGISSIIHVNQYQNQVRADQTSYQVTTYDTDLLNQALGPYMLTEKPLRQGGSFRHLTINRQLFIAEVEQATSISKLALMKQFGIDRQHFYAKKRTKPRISAHVVKNIAQALPLPKTLAATNIRWEEIDSIEPAGIEVVYDLTVEGTHNFVANGILVHNCVYQEQIMQIGAELFGYSLGEADLMRRAVSKKKEKDLLEHRKIFLQRGPERGVDEEAANKIFDDIEFFARYGFNKCVVGSTQIVDAETGRLVTVESLATGESQVNTTYSLDTKTLKIVKGDISAVMSNGVKSVYRLTTQTGRSIEATANHPFFTPQGWRLLGELNTDDMLAVPSHTFSPSEYYPNRMIDLQIEGDILWDRVSEIISTGEQPTYDLTIEHYHNFIANDIIVHNSHAADYAVITCQTAFLKRHFPHEYMAALMSVYYDDSDKVSVFINDCRRMKIEVLPPAINHSFADFHIETNANGRHLRFGFGAIKNVGLATVEYIIQQRAEGPFKDMDDFLKRCHMKDVGKRALESLIKVGAFDEFKLDRAKLLANLEQVMSFSADYHKNAATGQTSIFDMLGSGGGSNNVGSVMSVLKEIPPPAWDQREQLRWEKELMGLYISEHPLTKLLAQVENTNLYNTAELKESIENIKGRVIRTLGLVSAIRNVTTKKGDSMAILTFEDIQGVIEIICFPRTWNAYKEILKEDKIYIVEGKADLRGNDVQLIVEKVDQNLHLVTSADAPLLFNAEPPLVEPPFDEETGEVVKTLVKTAPIMPEIPPAVAFMEAQAAHTTGRNTASEEPPELREAFANANFRDEDAPDGDAWDEEPPLPPTKPMIPPPAMTTATSTLPVTTPAKGQSIARQMNSSYTVVKSNTPTPQDEYPDSSPRHLNIEIERSYDDEQDRRLIQLVHGIAKESPGRHLFHIIYIDAKGIQRVMSFPTYQILISRERIKQLEKTIGVKRVWVSEEKP